MPAANHTLVWDLPTRLFHWMLAAAVFAAAGIAFLADDDGSLFLFHAAFGLLVAFMVVLRVIYGFIGSRYARFSSFLYRPADVLAYARGVLTGKDKRSVGHNPGSAYAIFAMLALILGIAATGLLLGSGNESVQEIHEVLAITLLVVVAAHILGVVVHTLRHRENIAAGMIHGRKDVAASEGIPSARPLLGWIFLAMVALWTFRLLAGADVQARTLRVPGLGWTVAMDGEGESHAADRHGDEGRDDDD